MVRLSATLYLVIEKNAAASQDCRQCKYRYALLCSDGGDARSLNGSTVISARQNIKEVE